MKTAAIYARYSSEVQNPTSTADQVALCRAHATRNGWAVVQVYEEPAVSGAAAANRPVYLRLVRDAEAKAFDVVLVEDVSRLTRDAGELLQLYKRLAYREVALIGVSDGITTAAPGSGGKIHLAIKGLVNDLYLDDLREKTHRGLAAAWERSRTAGGKTLGYRTVVVDGANRVEIDEAEAEIVRRIFRDYATGRSGRAIAHRLNEEGVPFPSAPSKRGPARRGWGPTSVRCILRNEKYLGEWIWNRTKFVKDPATGRRRPRARLEAEWRRLSCPELQIVPNELWAAAHARAEAVAGQAASKAAHSPYLLTGLLSCECGARMVARRQTRRKGEKVYRTAWYYCGRAFSKGSAICTHRTAYRGDHLEGELAARLRAATSSEMLAEVERRLNDRLDAARAADGPRIEQLEAERSDLARKATHLIGFLAGGESALVRDELGRIESRLRALVAERAAIAKRAEATPARADMGWIRAKVDGLLGILTRDPVAAKAEIRRHLDSDLTIKPKGERRAEISGAVKQEGLLSEALLCGQLIAGTGFEPATSRL